MNQHFWTIGRVGKVDLFATQNSEVLKFSLATEKPYKDGDEWKKRTIWLDCEKWKPTDHQKSIKKGDEVHITGELRNNNYEKDGVKNYQIVINVLSIKKLNAYLSEDNKDIPF